MKIFKKNKEKKEKKSFWQKLKEHFDKAYVIPTDTKGGFKFNITFRF